MSEKYKIHDNSKPYFITMTTVGWVDIFTRKNHKLTVVKSLEHCQKHKGLIIFGWVLMHSHLHMICKADDGFNISDILRDFKKFTSKEIVRQIQEEPESRREWLLPLLKHYCKGLKRQQNYKVWQDGNHPDCVPERHGKPACRNRKYINHKAPRYRANLSRGRTHFQSITSSIDLKPDPVQVLVTEA